MSIENTNVTPRLVGEISTDVVYIGERTSEILTPWMEGVDDDIATLQSDMLGKASTSHVHSGYATANHTHTGYAAASHAHSEYAETSHTHDGYADADHTHSGFAAENHTHDGYATADHTHTGFAAENHTHDDYADADHTHTGFATENHSHSASDVGAAAADHTHSGFAAENHSHSEYAAASHTHSGYAPASHTHSDYADADHSHSYSDVGAAAANHTHNYAAANHTHDYAASTHSHTPASIGAAAASHSHTPASIGAAASSHTHSEYAASNHTHDYAASNHGHSAADVGALPASGGTVNGALTVTGAGTIKGKTYTQQILPMDAGSYSIGSSDNRFYSTYLRVNPNVSSDRRFKRDIETIGIDELAAFIGKLGVVSYNYKDDAADEGKRIGLIAQDVLAADEDLGRRFVEEDEKGFYSLRPADLVFPLIAAVQKLQKELDDLKK